MSRAFGESFELRIGEVPAREGIERNVGIAEFVIEVGADHPLRKRLANVADFLARLIPGIFHRLPAHRALEVDEDVGEAGPRVGSDKVEPRYLLQLAFDLVDHLLLHLLDGSARPEHLNDHHAKREVSILLLADAHE